MKLFECVAVSPAPERGQFYNGRRIVVMAKSPADAVRKVRRRWPETRTVGRIHEIPRDLYVTDYVSLPTAAVAVMSEPA